MATVRTSSRVPAPPRLAAIDHLGWWVGNARQSAGFFEAAFGFELVAYAGPETGVDDRVSFVLEQGDVRFVVSSALRPESPIAEHVRLHGDGVRDVAFAVDDAFASHEALTRRGARSVAPPVATRDDQGELATAGVAAYGDTVHSLVARAGYRGPFAPGYEPVERTRTIGPVVGIRSIDHVVANVERGRLGDWVRFYEEVFGLSQLQRFDEQAISTEYSALASTVVGDDGRRVVLPINEPADGRRKSQIEEYLDYYGSPGVQHVALRTPDVVRTVAALRERGVAFMSVPPTYYDEAKQRMDGIDLPWDLLEPLGILVDREGDGHLLQLFTESVAGRPTVFFEIIQREGAQGFGEGNFRALFEAIEREQARRGNL